DAIVRAPDDTDAPSPPPAPPGVDPTPATGFPPHRDTATSVRPRPPIRPHSYTAPCAVAGAALAPPARFAAPGGWSARPSPRTPATPVVPRVPAGAPPPPYA